MNRNVPSIGSSGRLCLVQRPVTSQHHGLERNGYSLEILDDMCNQRIVGDDIHGKGGQRLRGFGETALEEDA